MNVAFYAPLKAPDHPVPSGDRSMARLLLRALRRGGHQVDVVSRLRSFERAGDATAQARIRRRAESTVARLRERFGRMPAGSRPQAWFTYHLYHKAPDLLGPPLSEALGVPYLVAEASHAPKQAGGPWDAGYRCAAAAMRRAARILCLNPADEPCVRELLGGDARLRHMPPFIDARARAARGCRDASEGARRRVALGLDPEVPLLVSVAMMRPGAKLASYRVLANALERLLGRRWQLLVIGDGPARPQVESALAALGERVRYAGEVPAQDLPVWLTGCDLHLWPAVDEAWGMAILEAAAAGVASVAGDEGGVSSVLHHGRSGLLVRPRDPGAFAAATAALLDDSARVRELGGCARDTVFAQHDLPAATRALDDLLHEAVREPAGA